MTAPNWCGPCGGYRSRDHECTARPSLRPPIVQVPHGRENVEPAPPEASSPAYVAGWRAGYEAAMRDVHERQRDMHERQAAA